MTGCWPHACLQGEDAVLDADATAVVGSNVADHGAGIYGHHTAGCRIGIGRAGTVRGEDVKADVDGATSLASTSHSI